MKSSRKDSSLMMFPPVSEMRQDICPDVRWKCTKLRHLMLKDQPSHTAHRVAQHRAVHQLWDKPHVFNDPLAPRIIPDEAELARAKPEEAPAEHSLRAFVAARSRYAEDQLAEAVRRGVKQYVVLGAGLDTFAYRNPFDGIQVFEVDYTATQAW